MNDIKHAVNNDKITTLGDIKIRRDDYGITYFILPNNKIINLNLEAIENHNVDGPNFLEFITNPVFINDDELILPGDKFLWEVLWKEDYTSLPSISLGGNQFLRII